MRRSAALGTGSTSPGTHTGRTRSSAACPGSAASSSEGCSRRSPQRSPCARVRWSACSARHRRTERMGRRARRQPAQLQQQGVQRTSDPTPRSQPPPPSPGWAHCLPAPHDSGPRAGRQRQCSLQGAPSSE
eukprot:1141412-Alexandrium_andersonii.AAC.1